MHFLLALLSVLFSFTSCSQGQEVLASTAICPSGQVCPSLSTVNITTTPKTFKKKTATSNKGWVDPENCDGDFCLFYNTEFANGRGVAIISTRRNFWRIRDAGIRLETMPQNLKDVQSDFLKLGRSSQVEHDIPVYTQLLVKPPVLLVHRDFIRGSTVSRKKQNALLEAAVACLPDPTQKLFNSQLDLVNDAQKLRAVVRTRSFEINLGTDAVDPHGNGEIQHWHYVNYPEAGERMSHECSPSSAHHVDPYTFALTVTTMKPVEKGGKVTLNYLPASKDQTGTTKSRQTLARRIWGSPCTCPKCTASDPETRKSDAHIKEIEKIQKILDDHESRLVTVEMIQRLLKLYETEGMQYKIADAYTLAAMNYNGLGYDRKARKYAALAVKTGTMQNGADTPDVHIMRALRDDPKGHFSYNSRSTKGKVVS